jgi:Retroviral aspartyl protease
MGLYRTVQEQVGPQILATDTLEMIKDKAQRVYEFQVRFGIIGKISASPHSRDASVSTSAPSRSSSASASNAPKSSTFKRWRKLTPAEREYLSENNSCYFCHKVNAGHVAENCPDRAKFLKRQEEKGQLKEAKKESVSALVVESDSASEYSSHPKYVPTIKIATVVAGTAFPSTLADSGAMINVLSEDMVNNNAIPTHPIPPIRLCEPLNPNGTVVARKVVAKVEVPEESWESQQPAEFVVAPLKEHDAILGMSFLATENILIDPARDRVVLLKLDSDEMGKERVDEMNDADCCRVGVDQLDVVPSICPKVKSTSRKFAAPEPDLSWIDDFEEFEKSRPASTDLHKHLDKFNGVPPSDPTSRDEYFAELNDYFVKRYADVLAENLPDSPPHHDSPSHRIVLNDENLSLNGRNYSIPTRY